MRLPEARWDSRELSELSHSSVDWKPRRAAIRRSCECLRDGRRITIDVIGAAYCVNLSTERRRAIGERWDGTFFRNSREISMDLAGASHYLQLSTDYGNAEGHCCYARCLINGTGVRIGLRGAPHDLELSADQDDIDGQD